MAHLIDDDMIEYVGMLAKLEFSEKEREEAKQDMKAILDYIDMINELDTGSLEPISHIFPLHNVFREDVVEDQDDRDSILRNAPEKKGGCFQVPKTME